MIITATLLALLCIPAALDEHDTAVERILDAIRVVETGAAPDCGRDSVGDGGRAIGPFQIHWAYWKDANLPGQYEDCRNVGYARQVVLAYWRRYCPSALEDHDAEVLARTHNGGPMGAHRRGTTPYWDKVRSELQRTPARAARS